jgi:hypothetical protein
LHWTPEQIGRLTTRQIRVLLMDEESVKKVGELPDLKTEMNSKAGRKWLEMTRQKQAGAVANLMEGKLWHQHRMKKPEV